MQEEARPPVDPQPSSRRAASAPTTSNGSGKKAVVRKRAVAAKSAKPAPSQQASNAATAEVATPKPAAAKPARRREAVAAAPPRRSRSGDCGSAPGGACRGDFRTRDGVPRRSPCQSYFSRGPPADTPAADAEQPESAYGKSFMLFNATPGWLVSMAVHAVLLILLALFTVSGEAKRVQEIVLLDDDIAEQEVELFEPVEIEMADLEVQEISTQALSAQDMGIANLGSPQLMPNAVNVDIGAMGPVMEDIGLLFGADGKGLADTGAGYGGAEFFGVKAGGRKFVFIVDSSLSMKNGKFEAACYELEQAVRRLSEDQLFYVMFFDWDSNHLHLGQWDRGTPQLDHQSGAGRTGRVRHAGEQGARRQVDEHRRTRTQDARARVGAGRHGDVSRRHLHPHRRQVRRHPAGREVPRGKQLPPPTSKGTSGPR